MTTEEIDRKTGELAEKIISLTVGTLLLNMRFLARAVNRLTPKPQGEGMYCDGMQMLYEPKLLLSRYRENPRLPVHDCLHMLLHCIFRHWNIGNIALPDRWNAACDIAVEAIILQCATQFCPCEREDEKRAEIKKLTQNVNPLTAEKLYSYFVKNEISDTQISRLCELFKTDNHSGWHKNYEPPEYEPEEKQKIIGIGTTDENGDTRENEQDGTDNTENKEENEPQNDGTQTTASSDEKDAQEQFTEEMRQRQNRERAEQLEKLWKEISEEIRSQLENFEKNAGNADEHLTQAIAHVNRDRCDYSAFLRKFAVSGEAIKSDDSAFDIGFYSYGLSLYGNVALVEPLEYKEVMLVRDFVIAIDTSGSVSGALVEGFVKKTYSLLKSTESFFSKVNIYIIQCDTQIKEIVKITSDREFEKYIENLEIKGLGGTDFRPVFEYVDELRENGELTFLKGLIYFTDGFGKFPESIPKFDTAFAFMRDDYEKNGQPAVPAWAVKLILEEDDILYGK